MRFLLIAIDYFTKWVEAEALAMITEAKVQNFVWKNIVCRFGIPRMIISNKWPPVRQSRIQVVLLKPEHQEQVFVPRTSSGQWIDRSNEMNLAKNHQGSVSEGKRSMARGVTKHFVGLQDYSTNTHRRDALQPNLRNKSSHPS